MKIRAIVGACTVCLVAATTASAQSKTPSGSPSSHITSAPGSLHKAVSEAGVRVAGVNAAALQPSPRREKWNAVQWGAATGAAAGLIGGLFQPTHSNGEYVLGNSRVTSAMALTGTGAGIGALIGWAVDKGR
jgi:hypothetical protein